MFGKVKDTHQARAGGGIGKFEQLVGWYRWHEKLELNFHLKNIHLNFVLLFKTYSLMSLCQVLLTLAVYSV